MGNFLLNIPFYQFTQEHLVEWSIPQKLLFAQPSATKANNKEKMWKAQ